MNFDERIKHIISNGFDEKEKTIIKTWYASENNTKPRPSTKALFQLVGDIAKADRNEILKAMWKFNDQYEQQYGIQDYVDFLERKERNGESTK